MVTDWDLTYFFIYVILYAIFCAVACFITLAFDGQFEEGGDRYAGFTFIYSPGVVLLLLIPFISLLLLDKAIVFTGTWLLLWFFIVAIFAILVFVAAMPLVAVLMPLWVILGILVGWPVSLIIIKCLFGTWAVVSLLAGIRKLLMGRLEDKGVFSCRK